MEAAIIYNDAITTSLTSLSIIGTPSTRASLVPSRCSSNDQPSSNHIIYQNPFYKPRNTPCQPFQEAYAGSSQRIIISYDEFVASETERSRNLYELDDADDAWSMLQGIRKCINDGDIIVTDDGKLDITKLIQIRAQEMLGEGYRPDYYEYLLGREVEKGGWRSRMHNRCIQDQFRRNDTSDAK